MPEKDKRPLKRPKQEWDMRINEYPSPKQEQNNNIATTVQGTTIETNTHK